MDYLTEEEMLFIREDVKNLVEDTESTVHIIYRRQLSQTVNMSTGAIVQTWQETEIDAYKGDYSVRELSMSKGILEVGDQFYVMEGSSLTAPSRPEDRIMEMDKSTADREQRLSKFNAGTVALINGSVNVVGTDTQFITDGVQGGDVISFQDTDTWVRTFATIKSVTSETALILKAAWAFAHDLPIASYNIVRIYNVLTRTQDPIRAAIRIAVRRAGA